MEINNKKPLFTSKLKPDSKIQDAIFFYMRGIAAYHSGNNQEAEKDFTKAVDTENNNAIAYFNRGTFYLNEKKYKQAIDDFLKATKLRAKFAEAYYNLACAFVQILSFREGLAHLKRAVSLEKQFGKMATMDTDFRSIKKMKEFKEITSVYIPSDQA